MNETELTFRWTRWRATGEFHTLRRGDIDVEKDLQRYIAATLTHFILSRQCDGAVFRLDRSEFDLIDNRRFMISGILKIYPKSEPPPPIPKGKHPNCALTIRSFALPECYLPGCEVRGRLYLRNSCNADWCAMSIPDPDGRIRIEGGAWLRE